jgi:hypothetical protein
MFSLRPLRALSPTLFTQPASAPPPSQAHASLHREVNSNARVRAGQYIQPDTRGIDVYRKTVTEPGGRCVFDELKPGDRVVDSGGGWGLAGLHLASEGILATVINAQPNYTALALRWRAVANGDLPLLKVLGQKTDLKLIRALGLGSELEAISAELGPRRQHRSRALVETAVEQLSLLRRRGQFDYRTGFAEEVLPQLAPGVRLITDVWGAFSYSPERVKLLAQYHQLLAEGGEAMVLHSRQYRTFVRLPSGKQLPFTDYLKTSRPAGVTVFTSNEKGGNPVIKLTRQTDKPLDLNLNEAPFVLPVDPLRRKDFQPPDVVYTVARPADLPPSLR